MDGLSRTESLAAYEDTPADEIRRGLFDGSFKVTGDPEKMVDAMLTCVNASPAPLRLTLGGSSYEAIHNTLSEQLAALEAQKEIAFSTDLDD